MIDAVCIECGAVFQAKTRRAKYCSEACKSRRKRERVGGPIMPEAAPRIAQGATTEDDVARAIVAARTNADAFAKLGGTAPWQLRPGCARIAVRIEDALESEGW